MDIFAELEKLRMEHHGCICYPCPEDGFCNCGADKHNETLDGVIEWLKSQKDERQFGCYLNEHNDGSSMVYMFCDYDLHGKCMWSKSKETCNYWKEIK